MAQSQKRSAVYDIVTNPTNVTVEVTLTKSQFGSSPILRLAPGANFQIKATLATL